MVTKKSRNSATKETLKLERTLKVLKLISENYSSSSEEYKAIEIAGKALISVFQNNVKRNFEHFLQNFDGELTDAQKKNLKKLGLT